MVQRCFERMVEAQATHGDFGLAMHWWQRMRHYIKRRTPEQIERMERERGLKR